MYHLNYYATAMLLNTPVLLQIIIITKPTTDSFLQPDSSLIFL